MSSVLEPEVLPPAPAKAWFQSSINWAAIMTFFASLPGLIALIKLALAGDPMSPEDQEQLKTGLLSAVTAVGAAIAFLVRTFQKRHAPIVGPAQAKRLRAAQIETIRQLNAPRPPRARKVKVNEHERARPSRTRAEPPPVEDEDPFRS